MPPRHACRCPRTPIDTHSSHFFETISRGKTRHPAQFEVWRSPAYTGCRHMTERRRPLQGTLLRIRSGPDQPGPRGVARGSWGPRSCGQRCRILLPPRADGTRSTRECQGLGPVQEKNFKFCMQTLSLVAQHCSCINHEAYQKPR